MIFIYNCDIMDKNNFVIKYYDDIKKACSMFYSKCSNYLEFDDYFQDTILEFLTTAIYDENKNTKPFSFICIIAKNIAYNECKFYSAKRRKLPDEFINVNKDIVNDDFEENQGLNYYEDYSKIIADDLYKKCEKILKGRQREIFKLTYLGYNQREIENIMGYQKYGCSSQLYSARKKIKDNLMTILV